MRTTRFLLAFFLVLGLVSCDPSKRTTKTNKRPVPSRPTAPTDKPDLAKMDTVRWSAPSSSTPPPITNETPRGEGSGAYVSSDPARRYRLALMLPFLTNQFDQYSGQVPEKSDYALHFYSGAKLAFEQLSLENPNLKIQVDVVDTYLSDGEFYPVLDDPRVQAADLFIGPIRGSHVGILGKQNKVYGKPILSPFSPTPNVLTDYPNYVQLKPSLEAHCEAILEQVLKTNRPEQIVLVCREKEQDRFAYFKGISTRKIIEPDKDEGRLTTDLKSEISYTQKTIFIVPSWSSQAFVNTFLRELRAKKGRNEVEVYGMPQWEDYETIEPELYRDNNVHIVSGEYINTESERVKTFKNTYIERYNTVPTKYAYDGYDVAYWAGKSLAQFGLNFAQAEKETPYKGLRNGFGIKPKLNAAVATDYLENKHLFILKYSDNRFQPITLDD